ncbi:hypothetical protein, partial [Phascolarctobacterium succinatutens]|uniref:hypothetical protein n=1 Tax=Phascolarctobacterium succinatutens TaxID=626940 RepID=UPI0026E932C0
LYTSNANGAEQRRSISQWCGLRSAAEKEGACYMDDFTINFAITLIVLLIGLAFIGGNDEK